MNDDINWLLKLAETLVEDEGITDVYDVHLLGLSKALKTLSDREVDVLTQHFKYGKTYKTIGTELGVSGERIRQILSKAKRRLLRAESRRVMWLVTSPDEVARLKSEILYLRNLCAVYEAKLGVEEPETEEEPTCMTSIDVLDLSARASNCLHRAGVETIGQLVSMKKSEVFDISGIGLAVYTEIVSKLDAIGVTLMDD